MIKWIDIPLILIKLQSLSVKDEELEASSDDQNGFDDFYGKFKVKTSLKGLI